MSGDKPYAMSIDLTPEGLAYLEAEANFFGFRLSANG